MLNSFGEDPPVKSVGHDEQDKTEKFRALVISGSKVVRMNHFDGRVFQHEVHGKDGEVFKFDSKLPIRLMIESS